MKSRLLLWLIRAYRSLVLTSVEAFLAMLCLLAALPVLIDPRGVAPDNLLAALPLWLVYVWGVNLLLGAGLTLLGILTSAVRIEQAGVFTLGSVGLVFVLVGISQGGVVSNSGSTSFIYGAFSAAMYARFVVLGRMLRLLRAYMGVRH